MPWVATSRFRAASGLLIAAGAAAVAAWLFQGHDVRVVLPLWFVAVLVVLALRYGIGVGVVGSLLAGAIFATMLFSPLGSFRVADHAARQNLAWMILGGIALSCLFAPSDSAHRKS